MDRVDVVRHPLRTSSATPLASRGLDPDGWGLTPETCQHGMELGMSYVISTNDYLHYDWSAHGRKNEQDQLVFALPAHLAVFHAQGFYVDLYRKFLDTNSMYMPRKPCHGKVLKVVQQTRN